jgi:hypothetical protein
MQSQCNRNAIALQSQYNRIEIAIATRSTIAISNLNTIALRSQYNHSAIAITRRCKRNHNAICNRYAIAIPITIATQCNRNHNTIAIAITMRSAIEIGNRNVITTESQCNRNRIAMQSLYHRNRNAICNSIPHFRCNRKIITMQ